MPTRKQLLQNLAEDNLQGFCQLFDLPDPEDFPRPSEADGKSPDELASLLCSVGFEFDRKATHSNLYRHSAFPSVIVGIASTPGDKRGGRNLLSEARQSYADAVIGARNTMGALAIIEQGCVVFDIGLACPTEIAEPLRTALSNFVAAMESPDAELPALSTLQDQWELGFLQKNLESLKAAVIDINKRLAEQSKSSRSTFSEFSPEMSALLKSATPYGAQCAVEALRKIEKEFGAGYKKTLEAVGVPKDMSRLVADMLFSADDPIFPETSAQALEAHLAELRSEKKKGKKKSGRSFAAKDVKPDVIAEVYSKLRKLPTMDIEKLVAEQLSLLNRRQLSREELLRDALKDQLARAEKAEAALKPSQEKIAELTKLAKSEAERADDLADKLDEARAAATDNTAVQKLISDLHVAVDGFRVKHAQADLEHIEEILLGFQVETGVEAEVKA